MNARLEDIQIDDLSPRLRELVTIVGFGPAIKLVRARGGVRIEIPNTLKAESSIVRLIGVDAAEQLLARYGSGFLEIDRGVKALRAARDRAFYIDARELSGNQLALKYEMTARHVWRLLSKRTTINDRQSALL